MWVATFVSRGCRCAHFCKLDIDATGVSRLFL